MFVKATYGWHIATATGRLMKTRSCRWSCKSMCTYIFLQKSYRCQRDTAQTHSFCLSKGRMVCRWSRWVTRRTSRWRLKSPIWMEMMRMKPLCWPPSRPRLPTLLFAFRLMWASRPLSLPALSHTHILNVRICDPYWNLLFIPGAKGNLCRQYKRVSGWLWAWKPLQT